jgi:dihydropyrimidine dehydrogenase (NAD+) subunit PreT
MLTLRQTVRSACSSKSKATRLPDGRLTQLGAILEAERCLLCVDAPCAKACPAGTQPDKFLRQLRFENPLGAAETVLDNNPLGGVCGSVCPVSKLCEGACSRKVVDEPIKIGAVQRYLHDLDVAQKLELPPVPLPIGHKTAVIGAGPAGLSAARELVRKGSQVTVYERRPQAGGALRYALSPLRMDHHLVDEEVQRIAAMGVKFVFNSTVLDTKTLLAEGFDAVFVSPGLQTSRMVDIRQNHEHWQKDGIIGALSFLESANTLEATRARHLCTGKTVVVIGGGSVAMDCAITAKSLGAETVHIVARDSLLALPADEDEIRLVREIGGIFHPEAEVVEVSGENVVKVAGYSHQTHSRTSAYNAEIRASTVIVAAGQLLDETGKMLIKGNASDGVIVKKMSDNKTEKDANQPAFRVFAGGDAVRGGGDTVVQAVADGKRAAVEILPTVPTAPRKRVSLETEFVGIRWENPFTLSSSPVTNSAEMIARAYDAGFSGAYYKTLNREDKFSISHPSPRLGVVHGRQQGGMDIGIQNMEQISDRPLADNLKDINWLRKNYPNKVTAVSIMGYCDEDWEYLAKAAEVSLFLSLSLSLL